MTRPTHFEYTQNKKAIAVSNDLVAAKKYEAYAVVALIAMLTTSLIPFSFERGGLVTGVWAVLGFAISFLQR